MLSEGNVGRKMGEEKRVVLDVLCVVIVGRSAGEGAGVVRSENTDVAPYIDEAMRVLFREVFTSLWARSFLRLRSASRAAAVRLL